MSGKVKIPKDIVESGNTDSQCYAHFFGATEEEVEEKRKRYFENYHPHGYSTYTDGVFQSEDGYWFCHITRYHSCD